MLMQQKSSSSRCGVKTVPPGVAMLAAGRELLRLRTCRPPAPAAARVRSSSERPGSQCGELPASADQVYYTRGQQAADIGVCAPVQHTGSAANEDRLRRQAAANAS